MKNQLLTEADMRQGGSNLDRFQQALQEQLRFGIERLADELRNEEANLRSTAAQRAKVGAQLYQNEMAVGKLQDRFQTEQLKADGNRVSRDALAYELKESARNLKLQRTLVDEATDELTMLKRQREVANFATKEMSRHEQATRENLAMTKRVASSEERYAEAASDKRSTLEKHILLMRAALAAVVGSVESKKESLAKRSSLASNMQKKLITSRSELQALVKERLVLLQHLKLNLHRRKEQSDMLRAAKDRSARLIQSEKQIAREHRRALSVCVTRTRTLEAQRVMLQEASNACACANTRLCAAESTLKSAESRMQVVRDENTRLLASVEEVQNAIVRLECAGVREAEAALDCVEREFAEAVKQETDALSEHKCARVAEKSERNQIHTLDVDVAAAELRHAKIEKRLSTLQLKIATSECRLSSLDKELAAQEADVDLRQAAVSDALSKVEDVQRDIMKSQAELDTANQALQTATERYRMHGMTANPLKNALNSLDASLAEANHVIRTREDEWRASQTHVLALQKKRVELRFNIEAISKRIHEAALLQAHQDEMRDVQLAEAALLHKDTRAHKRAVARFNEFAAIEKQRIASFRESLERQRGRHQHALLSINEGCRTDVSKTNAIREENDKLENKVCNLEASVLQISIYARADREAASLIDRKSLLEGVELLRLELGKTKMKLEKLVMRRDRAVHELEEDIRTSDFARLGLLQVGRGTKGAREVNNGILSSRGMKGPSRGAAAGRNEFRLLTRAIKRLSTLVENATQSAKNLEAEEVAASSSVASLLEHSSRLAKNIDDFSIRDRKASCLKQLCLGLTVDFQRQQRCIDRRGNIRPTSMEEIDELDSKLNQFLDAVSDVWKANSNLPGSPPGPVAACVTQLRKDIGHC